MNSEARLGGVPTRAQQIVPWALFALIFILMMVGRYTEYRATGKPDDGWFLDSLMGSAFMTFPGVGALIVSRLPGHRFGWLLLLIGGMAATLVAGTGYAHWEIGVQGNINPIATLGASVYQWLWFPLLFTTATFLFLLFPTGTYPSRGWRWVGRAALLSIALITIPSMLPEELIGDNYRIDNPIGIEGLADVESKLGPLFVAALPIVILSLVSLIFRYRKASSVERQQMKWVALAAVLFGVTMMTADGLGLSDVLFPLFLACIPASMAISILKYRLYDIDVILNRALVYGSLTAILAGAYLAIVFALQQVLPVGQGSDIAVAASTLAVAALFRPARARVQAFIDRRFFRHKYDAAATLQSFASRLRDEVELEIVQQDLLRAAAETMHPAHASLWLASERA